MTIVDLYWFLTFYSRDLICFADPPISTANLKGLKHADNALCVVGEFNVRLRPGYKLYDFETSIKVNASKHAILTQMPAKQIYDKD